MIAEGAEGRHYKEQTGKDTGDKHLEVMKMVMNDGKSHSRYNASRGREGGREGGF